MKNFLALSLLLLSSASLVQACATCYETEEVEETNEEENEMAETE